MKESYPSLPHLVLAQIRAIVAGWKTDQETGAKLIYEQNQEWQLLARGRRDINQIAAQLRQPNQLKLSRVIGDQKKEFLNRAEKGESSGKEDFHFAG